MYHVLRKQETARRRRKHCSLPFVMMRRIRPWNSAKNLHRDDGYKSIVRMCCVCVLLITDWNASSWLNTHVTGHVMRDPHKSKAVKGDQVTMELSNEIQSQSREFVTSWQIPLPVKFLVKHHLSTSGPILYSWCFVVTCVEKKISLKISDGSHT